MSSPTWTPSRRAWPAPGPRDDTGSRTAERWDPRATLLLLGAGYVVVSGGAALVLLRAPWRRPVRHGAEQADHVAEIVGSRAFRRSRLALAVAALGLYAVTLNLVPLLTELGFGYQDAALAFGLVGAGQVLGRLVFVPLSGLGTPRSRTVTQVSLSAGSIGLLAAVPGPPQLVTASAVLCGAVRGAHTLSVAKVVSDRWGTESYGTLLGRFHGVVAVAMAIGPVVGTAAALALDSYRLAALALAALGVSAIAVASRS
ncbi:MFS transporter [Actinomycetospora cinnamomea]|uniref:MFS transporter n=1 Tax=Actinomycetospora cinnamomea TaxID=663609 RepID=A0A2U1FB10_9PSEU|nr:MFS transporter [Actinomycetospora cinnamomea]PVZ09354.1 MFS transporter [Actinomycetospora cinnamomea]